MGLFNLSEENERYVKQVFLLMIMLAVMYFIPQMIGFGKGGFNVVGVLDQFQFYLQTGIAGAVIIFLAITIERIIKKDDSTFGNGLGFLSPGEVPHAVTKIFKNQFRLLLACVIIFSILGVFAGATRQTYFGVGTLEQQFTKFDNTVYNAALVATSENFGAAAIIAIVLLTLRFVARSKGWSRENYVGIAWISAIGAVMAYGVTNHLLRYGTSDQSIFAVAVIWGIGAALTMLTGSFIPFWTLHVVNNVFFDLGRYFAIDSTQIYIWGFIASMSVLFLWLYVIRKPRRGDG